MKLINIATQPQLIPVAVKWFAQKWNIAEEAYAESMQAALVSTTGVPSRIVVLNEGNEIIAGLLLVTLGSYIAWAISCQSSCSILNPTIRIAALLLLIDGVSAICFMPHNPFAWAIATLCIIEVVLSFLKNK